MCLPLYCGVCFLTQFFAYSSQVLIDSVYSHDLPVMLQSWASLPAYRFLSDSPLGYHSNHEKSPKMPAKRKKKLDTWGNEVKMEKNGAGQTPN